MDKPKSLAIGIDLGTTYSCIGIFKDGHCQIIPDLETGSRTFPSYVAFHKSGRLIGHQAKNEAEFNPQNTVYDVKRLIGQRYEDIEDDLKLWPFKVIEENSKIKIEVAYRNKRMRFAPEQISAMVLSSLKAIAESFLGTTVTDAVVTVPAYFNDCQRQATKNAGKIAGLNVLRIINEPTAAALAYGLDKITPDFERNVLVFDLGGGTFDVSILRIVDGVFEVKATSGDTHLGGEDFDNRLVQYFIDEYIQENCNTKKGNEITEIEEESDTGDEENEEEAVEEEIEDLRNNKNVMSILKAKCELAKRELSKPNTEFTKIEINDDNLAFSCIISKDKFEELCQDLFNKVLVPVQNALNDAKMDRSAIDDIVLVGGSTRIPKIEEILYNFFGSDRNLNKSINPDESVAYGAAIQAAIIAGNKSANLNECVLVDVIPMSLGIETDGGKMQVLIKRNSLIPAKETKFFSPTNASQSVDIKVFEGEDKLTRNNNLLGKFRLNFPKTTSENPKIELTFFIDTNGILEVSIVDSTGNNEKYVIDNVEGRLSILEITKMIQMANENDQFDRKQKEIIAAKASLEELIGQIEAVLQSNANEKLTNFLKETIDWLNKTPLVSKEELQAKKESLEYEISLFKENTSNTLENFELMNLSEESPKIIHYEISEIENLEDLLPVPRSDPTFLNDGCEQRH